MASADVEAALQHHREKIDEIDEQLVDLLGQRYNVCRQVGEYKRANGLPMMQSSRVHAVTERSAAIGAEHSLEPSFVRTLYKLIIDEACRLEENIISERSEERRPEPSRLAATALGIDHVAIACSDLETAIDHYRDTLGFELDERRTTEGAHSGMLSATMKAGPITVVLVQGTSPESNVSKYIEHYGPGVQHVALESDSLTDLLEDLRERGSDLLTGVIHSPGLDQVFTKREPNSGIQLEFIARGATEGFSDSNVQELFEAMERENVY